MARRLRLLDLFCGAGGAGAGYARAGFDVVGIDIADQPSYPFEFHQADALDFPLGGFDAVHASPPCQRYSALTARWGRQGDHPDLIAVVRERLADVPHVIENVPGAPLRDPIRLCGSSFGLDGAPAMRHSPYDGRTFPPAGCPKHGREWILWSCGRYICAKCGTEATRRAS